MVFKIFLIIFCLFLPFIVYGTVVINEIAWMGSEVGWRDEWIELRNMTNRDIDLSGWVIENALKNHGSLEIPPDGKHVILSNSYYLISYYSKVDNLLEPKTALDVIVDWRVKTMGDISLANNYNNNGQLRLKDHSGTLIDQTPSPTDNNWPAGDNKTKQTMERTISGNWQNSQEPNGTPKAENSVSVATESPPSPLEEASTQSEPQSEPETHPEPELPPQKESSSIKTSEDNPQSEPEPAAYPSDILINEITPSPEGPDKLEEWLELKNTNDQEVDISGWKIQDTTGSAKTYTFPEGTKIGATGYLVLSRPVSKITLNNSGDGLQLIQPNGAISNIVTYGKAPLGQSYNRTKSGWAWSTILTPGEKNAIPEKEPYFAEASRDKNLTESGSRAVEKQKSEINLATQRSKPPVFLIALIVAIFSGITILIVKNSLF